MDGKRGKRSAKRNATASTALRKPPMPKQLSRRIADISLRSRIGSLLLRWLGSAFYPVVALWRNSFGKLWPGSLALASDQRSDAAINGEFERDVASSHGGVAGKADATVEHLVRLLLKRREKEVQVDASIQKDLLDYLRAPSSSQVRELVILRGPPGIGKSTYALQLLTKKTLVTRLAHVCSTDDFFTRINAEGKETYCFNSKKLRQNHGRNQERVRLAITLGLCPIVIDNTNMTLEEMTPYVKIAKKSGYVVRKVEPQDIQPSWSDVEFLQERNSKRQPAGKVISTDVLKSMLARFQPSPGNELPQVCIELRRESTRNSNSRTHGSSATKSSPAHHCNVSSAMPEYVGINLDDVFSGSLGIFGSLWSTLSGQLETYVDASVLKLSRYRRPSPIHVTTFHSRELKVKNCEARAALANSLESDGDVITLSIEAIAVIPGALACALVTGVEPATPAPRDKLLHVTLAFCEPWRPVQSNELLRAVLDASVEGRVPIGSQTKDKSLWSFQSLDLCDVWQNDRVRVFEHLKVGGRECTAYLVRLPELLKVSGPRFRHR
jgi:predicted kinase